MKSPDIIATNAVNQTPERRRFKRFVLNGGLLFSDRDNLIGMAQVLDISRCGVRCASISPVACTICMLDNIELFGAEENLELTDLGGRMIRCSDNLIPRQQDSSMCYYEFGFEFFPRHYPQLTRLKRFLSEED
jgi:hypothetical protein